MLNRWPFVSRSARVFCRLTFLRYRIEAKLPLIHSVEKKLFDFHRYTPGAFWASLALNFGVPCMAILEVYLILWLMGIKIGLIGALVFEALTKLVNVVGALNPGNVGSYEGGNMLIAKMFGLTGVVGLSVALTRRLRAIFWTAVGGLCLFLLSKSKAHRNSGKSISEDITKTPQSRMGGAGGQPGVHIHHFCQLLSWNEVKPDHRSCGSANFLSCFETSSHYKRLLEVES